MIVPAGLSWLLLLIFLLKLLRLLLLSQVQSFQLTTDASNLLRLQNSTVSVTWLVFLCVVGNTNELACSLIISLLSVRSEELPLVWRGLFEGRIAISWTVDFLMVVGGPTSTALASNVHLTNANFFTKLRLSTLWELLLLDLRLTTLWYHAQQLWIVFVLWARMLLAAQTCKVERVRRWYAHHECTSHARFCFVAVTGGNVTRSLGEDVHVVLVEKKRSNVRIDVEWSPTTRTANGR